MEYNFDRVSISAKNLFNKKKRVGWPLRLDLKGISVTRSPGFGYEQTVTLFCLYETCRKGLKVRIRLLF